MKRLSFFLALGALCAWAIDIPRIGYARDPQGMVHRIDGLSGNFLVSDPVAADRCVGFAWNGSFGIRQAASGIEWWDSTGTIAATFAAPASGAAVIGFDRSSPQTGWIYSIEARSLSRITAARQVEIPIALSETEEVLALLGGPGTVDVAVARGGGIFVATFDQASGSRMAEAPLSVAGSSRVLLLEDGAIVGLTGATVWMRRTDGSKWSADLKEDPRTLTWMGREWIQISGAGWQLALRIRPGSDPGLFTIPGPGAAVTQ